MIVFKNRIFVNGLAVVKILIPYLCSVGHALVQDIGEHTARDIFVHHLARAQSAHTVSAEGGLTHRLIIVIGDVCRCCVFDETDDHACVI